MKKIITAACLLAVTHLAMAQCNPIGWVKVGERTISMTERQCIYEKNGARVAIIVSGFCPMSPC